MPLANKDYTFYQVPIPQSYRRLSRAKRVILEVSVGLLVLALLGIGASVQMPRWLLAAGWALLLAYWGVWIVLYLKAWVRRQFRQR